MKPLNHHLRFVLLILVSIGILNSCRKDDMKVETLGVTHLMATSAIAGGNIIEAGEGIEQHGHCWDTIPNPTINSDKTQNGPASKTGAFTSQLTELIAGETYHIRAYLQTGNEIVYGKDIAFTTPDGKARISTAWVTNITFNSALSGGNIQSVNGDSVLLRGVCWDTLESVNLNDKAGFTTNGSGKGSFISELMDLISAKRYYVKAYAITSADTSYAFPENFVTRNGRGTMETAEPSSVTTSAAISGGNITDDGGSAITARGVCYGTNENPSITDNVTDDGTGTGTFTSALSSLTPNTTYYVRAYATNIITTFYGNQRSFLTRGLPELSTSIITNITYSSATCGGNITTDWGYPVTTRGVCWSTSPDPTIADNRTTDGSGNGSFTSTISGLTQGVTYYVRAYATNIAGTSYGEQLTFILPFPTVVVEIFNPATGRIWMDRNLGASSPGNIGDLYQWGRGNDGHQIRISGATSEVTSNDAPAHGIFIIGHDDWRSPQNDNLWQGVNGINNPCPNGYRVPTESELMAERNSWSNERGYGSILHLPWEGFRRGDNGQIEEVTDAGVYWSSTVNGLYARQLYRYHLGSDFGNSSRSTGYSVRCIKDLNGFPFVKTAYISNRTNNTASCGGNVTEDGGFPVTERGVCWSTNPDPTTADSKTTDSNGTGSFTSNISGLTQTGTYYVRAYATNSTGTSYGQQVIITPMTAIIEVINPVTGRTWMDRNLGASRVATSSNDTEAYGYLYQWGRGNDGHEIRTSGITSALSSSDTTGHGLFIIPAANPYNWRRPPNPNLWQGVNGTNNPCPNGYRLPTLAEWEAEYKSWSSNDATGAYGSILKLPAAGTRNHAGNELFDAGSRGYYWSETVDPVVLRALTFSNSQIFMDYIPGARGCSVRCIKER